MSAGPDFVGIGTHLAGTQWWAELLGDHPLVHGPAGGDWSLDFFSPFCARPMQDADVAAYRARFPRQRPGVVGEWSQRYLYDAWTLPLLRRAAPDAKLLVLLRDPVERYRAALSIRLAEERRHGKWVSMTDFVHRGRYASQLRVLHAFFPPEQVLLLQYERCLSDPLAEYERTLAFLGVEPGDPPRSIRRLQRRGARPGPAAWVRGIRADRSRVPVELWPDLLAALRTELEAEIVDLARIAPDIDTALWAGFAPTESAPERHGLGRRATAAIAGAAVLATGVLTAAAALLTDLL